MLVFKQKEAKVRCDCGEEISVNTQDFETLSPILSPMRLALTVWEPIRCTHCAMR